MIVVLAVEEDSNLQTSEIPHLAKKMETALPGIFPEGESRYAHMCGAGTEQHNFREEIEQGTTIPHMLEHLILHLLSRSNNTCSGFSGQRSSDLERGVQNHYYVVTDYVDKLQAVVAVDLAVMLASAWMSGRTIRLDAEAILKSVHDRLAVMLSPPEMLALDTSGLALDTSARCLGLDTSAMVED